MKNLIIGLFLVTLILGLTGGAAYGRVSLPVVQEYLIPVGTDVLDGDEEILPGTTRIIARVDRCGEAASAEGEPIDHQSSYESKVVSWGDVSSRAAKREIGRSLEFRSAPGRASKISLSAPPGQNTRGVVDRRQQRYKQSCTHVRKVWVATPSGGFVMLEDHECTTEVKWTCRYDTLRIEPVVPCNVHPKVGHSRLLKFGAFHQRLSQWARLAGKRLAWITQDDGRA